MNKYNSKTIILFIISIFLFIIVYNFEYESFIVKEKSTEPSIDVFDLKKFEEKDITGNAGDLEKYFSKNNGKLWLGSWNSGKCGENYYVYNKSNKKVTIGSVQLLLSGKHNTGANKANGDSSQQTQNELSKKMYQADNRKNEIASYKLRIEGYSNNGTWIYPIHCSDKNGNVDFSIRNRLNIIGVKKLNRSLCTMAGDLFVNNDLTITGGNIDSKRGDLTLNEGSIKCKFGSIECKNLKLKDGNISVGNSVNYKESFVNNLYLNKSAKDTPNINSDCSSTDSFARNVLRHLFPKGTIIIFDSDKHQIPDGWEECNGGMTNNKYPPIFQKPDLRGRAVFGRYGVDGFQTLNRTSSSLGIGKINNRLQIHNIPSHNHIINSDNSIPEKTIKTHYNLGFSSGRHNHGINSYTGNHTNTHSHGKTVFVNGFHNHNINHKHTKPIQMTNLNGQHRHRYKDFHFSESRGPHGHNYGRNAGPASILVWGYEGVGATELAWQHLRNKEDMSQAPLHRHYIPANTTESPNKNTTSAESSKHKHSITLESSDLRHRHYFNSYSNYNGEHTHSINIDEILNHNHSGRVLPTGQNRTYTNMPPYKVLMYIIKVF